jgi:iron complex outermembrane recepter protein
MTPGSRVPRLVAVAVAVIAGAAPTAAEPGPDPAAGEVIVVTGLRVPRRLADVPATVTVLDRGALDRAAHALADDVLRAVPSVATFRRSSSLVADPTSQGLALRGLGPSGVSRAVVLADGIPQNDPFGGWIYWRAIPLLSLDRIEVVPGGASSLFGNFGLGGAVQMVSRPIDRDRIQAIAGGGSLGTGRAAARVQTVAAGFGVALDGAAFRSDGYTPVAPEARGAVDHPAASSHATASVRVERALGDRGDVAVFGRWFDESLDAGTDHTTADVRELRGGATAHLALGGAVVDLTAFATDQVFRQQRARVAMDRGSATPASRQRTPSHSEGASAMVTTRPLVAAGEHVVTAGVDALRVTGEATDELVPAMPTADTLAERSAGGEQRFLGAFAQDAYRVGPRLELSAAVRLDAWQDRGGHQDRITVGGEATHDRYPDRSRVQLDPRLGVLARVTPALAIRASAYRAFRAPTLNELYRAFQVGTVLTAANPELEPETVWGGELGVDVTAGELGARAVGFWNHVADPIHNVTLAEPLPSGAMRQRQNLGAARVAGVELETRLRPSPRWMLAAAYTFTRAIVTRAAAQPELEGKHLAQDPAHRATLEVGFDDPALATVVAQARFAGVQFEDDQNTAVMDAYWVVDATASRRIAGGLAVFAGVTNLLDARYLVGRAGVDTVGAPRMFEVGVRYDSARGSR